MEVTKETDNSHSDGGDERPSEQHHETRGSRALTMTALYEQGLLLLTISCVATVRAGTIIVVAAVVAGALASAEGAPA